MSIKIAATKVGNRMFIDHDVPIPASSRRSFISDSTRKFRGFCDQRSDSTREFFEALQIMAVGDSVKFLSSDEIKGEQFRVIAKRHFGYKMTRRKSSDKKTIRYWRIE
tara:strand:- start:267 stop:590 length:324 start_codon:yes stop_codon:yes gene_type:complete